MDNEITAIHHLVEAHAVIFRQHILHRYQKTQMRESVWNESQIYGLKPTHVKFEIKFTDNNESLKKRLLDLPKGTFCFLLFLLFIISTFYINISFFISLHRMVHDSSYCSI